ncbi:MAG: hypothetical protein IAE89_08220 [Anaerolineae bacterium]|nr:hypothetical protein [Anaerolineae bacterium]
MSTSKLDQVLGLIDQLSPPEWQVVMEHLQESGDSRDDIAWKLDKFADLMDDRSIIKDFSNSRADWYDDDGR